MLGLVDSSHSDVGNVKITELDLVESLQNLWRSLCWLSVTARGDKAVRVDDFMG